MQEKAVTSPRNMADAPKPSYCAFKALCVQELAFWEPSADRGNASSNPCEEHFERFQLKLKLIYDRQSVGQSVLVSGAHLGLAINFSFSLKFSLDICGFVIL
jgi:hypothetical protein